ncbi:NAD(P)H-dependent flavin oxidoreductase [bacterium]
MDIILDIIKNKIEPLVLGDLEIKVPIIQGGMGVKVSTSSLASAVADCHAAGTIASVGLVSALETTMSNFIKSSNQGLQKEIQQAKKLSKGVVGVNILGALSNYKELVITAAQEKADFIVTGAGLPLNLPEYVENSSTKLIPIVSSDRAANIIIKTWKKRYDRVPDAVVVEGPLAGGHLGFSRKELDAFKQNVLEDLVADVLKVIDQYKKQYNTNIPVIAAGGIFDGKDIAKFLKLGVQGVQMATRFVTTFECSVAQEFKDLYLKAQDEDIIVIDSPVGLPGRVIKTSFTDKIIKQGKLKFKCSYKCLKTCDPSTAPYCIAEALMNAADGDLDNGIVFAGSNVHKINKMMHVKDLIKLLMEETIAELGK